MSQTIDAVYRDYVTQGVPASGDHKPRKSEIRALLKQIQNGGGMAVTRNTYTALVAVTPPTENYMGIVLDDADATKNGYYSRVSSAWVWERGFPDTFARVTLTGSNVAQTGTVDAGVNPSTVEVYFAVVSVENTGPFLLTIGGVQRDVVNASGAALSAGEWTGGAMFFLNGSGDFQLINDAGSALAAANSATNASASALLAAAYTFYEFGLVSDLLADNNVLFGYVGSGATYEVAAGYLIRAQGFRYQVAASGASDHHLATAGGLKLYVLRDARGAMSVSAFGLTGTSDHTTCIAAAEALDSLGGGFLDLPGADYDIGPGGILLSGLSNIHLRGAGGLATRLIKRAGFTGTAAVVFSECANCSVDGVYVDSNGEDGNGIAAGPGNFNTLAGTASTNIHVANCTVTLAPDDHNYGIFFLNVDVGSIVNNDVDGLTTTPWLNLEMEGIECFGGSNIVVARNRIKNLSGNALSLFSAPDFLSPFTNIVYENNQATDCFGMLWSTASFGATNYNYMRKIRIEGNQGTRVYQRGMHCNINAGTGTTAPDTVIDGMTIANNQIKFATSGEGAVAGAFAAFSFSAALGVGTAADLADFECSNILHHHNVYDGLDTDAAALVSLGPIKGIKSWGNSYSRLDDVGVTGIYTSNAVDCSFVGDRFEKSQNYGALIEGVCTNLLLDGVEFIDPDQADAGTVITLLNTGSSSTGLRVIDTITRRPTGTMTSAALVGFANGGSHPQQEVRGNRYYGTVNVANEVGYSTGEPANSNRGTKTMSGGATSFTITTTACHLDSVVLVSRVSGTTVSITDIDVNNGSFVVTLSGAADGAIFNWRVL